MKAIWRGTILAESDNTVVVENNHYFPPTSINRAFFIESKTRSVCSWKGTAHYYTIRVEKEDNEDAAWYYPSPKEAAREITNHIAFWRGVEVTE